MSANTIPNSTRPPSMATAGGAFIFRPSGISAVTAARPSPSVLASTGRGAFPCVTFASRIGDALCTPPYAITQSAMKPPTWVNDQPSTLARKIGTLTTNQTSRAANKASRATDNRLMPDEFDSIPVNLAFFFACPIAAPSERASAANQCDSNIVWRCRGKNRFGIAGDSDGACDLFS